jgi:hypothetical protein
MYSPALSTPLLVNRYNSLPVSLQYMNLGKRVGMKFLHFLIKYFICRHGRVYSSFINSTVTNMYLHVAAEHLYFPLHVEC